MQCGVSCGGISGHLHLLRFPIHGNKTAFSWMWRSFPCQHSAACGRPTGYPPEQNFAHADRPNRARTCAAGPASSPTDVQPRPVGKTTMGHTCGRRAWVHVQRGVQHLRLHDKPLLPLRRRGPWAVFDCLAARRHLVGSVYARVCICVRVVVCAFVRPS